MVEHFGASSLSNHLNHSQEYIGKGLKGVGQKVDMLYEQVKEKLAEKPGSAILAKQADRSNSFGKGR